MSDLGALSQSFVALIRGIKLPGPIEFEIPEMSLKANLSSRDSTIVLKIEIANTDEATGSALSIRVAEEFLSLLLAEFAFHVECSSEIRPAGSTFTAKVGSGPATVHMKAAAELSVNLGTDVAAFSPSESEITALANQVGLKLKVPEIPTSADLYTARKMFHVGMQSGDKIVRFLILYSATSLAALFKSGKCTQNAVDDLLKLANAGLSSSLRPSGPKKGEPESLYTKLRNDFVHADERGKDPVAARNAIETNSAAFQQDVAILLWKKL